MDFVAVGWLVWVALLVGVVAGWSVCEVFAVVEGVCVTSEDDGGGHSR